MRLQIVESEHKIAGGAFRMFHDFLVTEHHYIVLENSIRMNWWTLLAKHTFGRAALVECLQFDPRRPLKVRKKCDSQLAPRQYVWCTLVVDICTSATVGFAVPPSSHAVHCAWQHQARVRC